MPLLLIPFALVALFVWFVLSRKPAAKDALIAAPELAGRPSSPALGGTASRALPRTPGKALPPVA